MVHRQRRLEQEDAPLRIGKHDAAAFRTLHNLRVIEGRIETKQAELEPAPSVLRSVARTLIATGFGKDRHDVASKAYGRVGGPTSWAE